LCEESLTLCRELGDKAGIAFSLYQLGELAMTTGNPIMARMRTEEALALWREVGDKEGIAWALLNLAWFVSDQGEYARAHALLEESLAMHRASGNKRSEVNPSDQTAHQVKNMVYSEKSMPKEKTDER